LLGRLPRLAEPVDAYEASYWRAAAAGVRDVVGRSAPLRQIVAASALAALPAAVVNVGEVFLKRDTFHSDTAGFGFLASASGNRRRPRQPPRASPQPGRHGLPARPSSSVRRDSPAPPSPPTSGAAVPCALAGGIGNALFLAAATLVVQQRTGEGNRAQAFAVLDGAGTAAAGAGMVGGGALLALLHARGAWLLAAGVFALAAAGRPPATQRLRVKAEAS
jgi:hypothetical protein